MPLQLKKKSSLKLMVRLIFSFEAVKLLEGSTSSFCMCSKVPSWYNLYLTAPQAGRGFTFSFYMCSKISSWYNYFLPAPQAGRGFTFSFYMCSKISSWYNYFLPAYQAGRRTSTSICCD